MRYLPLLLALALVVYALVDCVQTPRAAARRLSKPVWLLVVVLLPVVGAAAWLLLGRPARSAPPRRRATPPPVAPDDDPDFLRAIRSVDEEHERMLRKWEDDLRRREGRLPDDDSE